MAIEPGPWVVPTSVESLIAAASAIRSGRRIRFRYQSHDQTVSLRQIEPWAVIHTDGRWYLIGHCLSRKAMRTFRLDRASHLELCGETFPPPVDFDARRYLAEHMPFVHTEYQINVWIDMPIDEAERNFAPWRVALEADDGGSRLRCGRDRLELFAAMLLSMGRRIVVHSPDELRVVFRRLSSNALDAADNSVERPTSTLDV